ncbi:hypothetical protein [Nocardioides renjunii]|uniref:hypothetical protein n=1 Tax=Nocardioides renjunii TaxID=3095075 RepID=UPI002AFDE6B8|nr:hypothetical protein [Nocardioides sp. S-34]WQQ22371.1 hypothetical protein SHK17_21075 [Nocardioides sp. S-34]
MSDAGLPPDQEAVRRLLAEARHDGPPPPEVVARLDETLAALAAERVDGPPRRSGAHEAPDAPVVDLGARRRRLAGAGLLAAAAVVVAGVAIGQGLPGVGGGDDAGSSAGGAADSSTSSQQDDQSGQDRSAPTEGSAELAPEALKSSGAAAPEADVPAVSSADADLDDRLLALRRGLRASPTRVELLDGMRALAECGLPDLGPGRRLLAEVDDRPGVVVFRRADGSAQQAEVYVCGTPEPVRTVSLPAR